MIPTMIWTGALYVQLYTSKFPNLKICIMYVVFNLASFSLVLVCMCSGVCTRRRLMIAWHARPTRNFSTGMSTWVTQGDLSSHLSLTGKLGHCQRERERERERESKRESQNKRLRVFARAYHI